MKPEVTSGWLGRYFDTVYPGFPDMYPNEQYEDPFAISLGHEVSATCQGHLGNFSHTLSNSELHNAQSITEQPNSVMGNSFFDAQIKFLNTVYRQSAAYSDRVKKALDKGKSISDQYNTKSELAVYLKQIATLISGGLNTKVYVVNLNGFDTHGNQVDNGAPETGAHAHLLKDLSDAIAAFNHDIKALGVNHRILGMTFSEFGRQIASNENNGTDHGDAAPLFIFGGAGLSGIHGDNPEIPLHVQEQEAIVMQVDFRNLYATVLHDWFRADEAVIQKLFEHQLSFLSLF
jgi:uncharacterized protein (DUF1501 family)